MTEAVRLEGGAARIDRPRFTIITSSFNQAHFLAETLHSVQEQGRSDVEHVVIDGGSTDGSVEVLRAHDATLAYWCSAPDDGQPSAWNEGLRHATGEIVAFLNSDDLYLPGALNEIDRLARAQPEAQWLVGGTRYFGEGSGDLEYPGKVARGPSDILYFDAYAPQPGHFFRRELFERVGTFAERFEWSFDLEFLIRCALFRVPSASTTQLVAAFRFHADSKTMAQREHQHADTRRVEDLHYPAILGMEGRRAARARGRYHGFLLLEAARGELTAGHRLSGWLMLAETLRRYPVMLRTRAFHGTVQRLLGLRRS